MRKISKDAAVSLTMIGVFAALLYLRGTQPGLRPWQPYYNAWLGSTAFFAWAIGFHMRGVLLDVIREFRKTRVPR